MRDVGLGFLGGQLPWSFIYSLQMKDFKGIFQISFLTVGLEGQLGICYTSRVERSCVGCKARDRSMFLDNLEMGF